MITPIEYLNQLINAGKISEMTPFLGVEKVEWSDNVVLDDYDFYDFIKEDGTKLKSQEFQNMYSEYIYGPKERYSPKTKPIPVSSIDVDRNPGVYQVNIDDGVNRYTCQSVNRVLIWFSCGVASAVAAKMAIERYGKDMCEVVCTDTGSEHDDNWRFLDDVSDWLGVPIIRIKSESYSDCNSLYLKDKYLVGVAGARCSLMLKKKVRMAFESVPYDIQVFGYDSKETQRAIDFNNNNPEIMSWFPLIEAGISKTNCFEILAKSGIDRPITYDHFLNANCIKSGCVKGQMGYWNQYRKYYPLAFWLKAKIERILDVAINKQYRGGVRHRLFLDELPPNAGNYKAEPAIQCGLFCNTNFSNFK